MVELIGIPKNLINKVWIKVENDISKALNRSDNYANSEHFRENCNKGIFQLWILWDKKSDNQYYGLVVTEIVQRPLQRCLNIRIMTGRDREKWQHMIKLIENFGIKNKCDKMELIARPGWERILKQFNYTKSHVLLEKKLKE
jgi:hypothetical protein